MRRLGAFAVAVALAACGDSEPLPMTFSQQRMEARQNAELAAEALRRGAYSGACRAGAAAASPRVAVLINAHQCLSCRDLGYMLRRVPPTLAAGGKTALIVPASDTAVVCAFLRQERIAIPTLTLPEHDAELANARTIVVATMDEAMETDSVYFGLTGTEILRRMEGNLRVPAPSQLDSN